MQRVQQIKRRVTWAVGAVVLAGAVGIAPNSAPAQGQTTVAQTANTAVASSIAGMSSWGGHQSRVVRTATGLYTTYLTGTAAVSLVWNVARQNADGSWSVVASGDAGREPASLLAAPDGSLYLVAVPGGVVTLFTGQPAATGPVTFSATPVPGMVQGDFPYLSAGINEVGDLCVVGSYGGWDRTGELWVSCRRGGQTSWASRTYPTEFRYAYTHVLPRRDGSLILVNTRDTTWQSLGYQQPVGEPDYAFDRFNVWQTDQMAGALNLVSSVEARPTVPGEMIRANAQADAYIDSTGRLHVLYWLQDASTGGAVVNRHRVLDATGRLLADTPITAAADLHYMKMIETLDGTFWLYLDGASSGSVQPFDPLTGVLGARTTIDTAGAQVSYAGFALTMPRGGSPRSNTVDAVFANSPAGAWRHIRTVSSGQPVGAWRQNALKLVGPGVSTMSGWGGFQSRVVSAPSGAWTVTTSNATTGGQTWRLWRRSSTGSWVSAASGAAGEQPANVMVEPDGTLVVSATPGGQLTTFRGRPSATGSVVLSRSTVPGLPVVQLAYSSGGTNAAGDVCLSMSEGGQTRGGVLHVVCRRGAGAWARRSVPLPFRYTNIRLFPGTDGTVTITGDRLTSWTSLGAPIPPSGNSDAANAMAIWRLNMGTGTLTTLSSFSINPTTAYPEPMVWTIDSFVDRQGQIHLLTWLQGSATAGAQRLLHRVLGASGALVSNRIASGDTATYMTMFEGPDNAIYAVHSGGAIARLNPATGAFTRVATLALGTSAIEHAGPAVSAPRSGSPRGAATVEVVYPTAGGTRWATLQLRWS